jgi:trimeric autotransporter adhesin
MNSFKKIAIAIAAALTSTVLVGSPATAAPTIAYTTMYDTTNGVQVLNGLATVTLTSDTSTVTTVAVSGVGNVVLAQAGTNTTLATLQAGAWYQVTTSANGPGTSTFILTSAVAGVTTLTATPVQANGTQGTAVTKTVTWTASGTLAASTAYTTVYSSAGATAPDATTNAVAIVSPMTANALAGNIKVTLKDGLNNPITNGTITVTVTGPGLVGTGTTQAGATLQGRAVTGSAGAYFVNIFGDGTPGVSTISVYTGSTLLATKTVTFSGVAATFSAAKANSVLKVGSNASAIAVTVKDSAGNLVADGTTVYASSETTTVASIAASATTVSGIATFAVQGLAVGSTTISFKNNTTTPTVSTTASVRVGSTTVASVVLGFDKSAYVNGEAVKLTIVALDASGLPVADGTYTNLLSEDIISSTQLGGASLVGSKSPALVDGVAVWNVYAPLSSGPFSVTGKVAATSVVLSAKAEVGNPTAAATAAATKEATDAANAATAAALEAAKAADAATAMAQQASDAVAALSTQVATLMASLKKQIAALTKLVIKIQKKVRA